jgi:hypothetical protein
MSDTDPRKELNKLKTEYEEREEVLNEVTGDRLPTVVCNMIMYLSTAPTQRAAKQRATVVNTRAQRAGMPLSPKGFRDYLRQRTKPRSGSRLGQTEPQ